MSPDSHIKLSHHGWIHRSLIYVCFPQRSNFVPFIEILKSRNVVESLDPGVDYRRKALAGSEKVKRYSGDLNNSNHLNTEHLNIGQYGLLGSYTPIIHFSSVVQHSHYHSRKPFLFFPFPRHLWC